MGDYDTVKLTPFKISFRYFGEVFNSNGAPSGMAHEIIGAAPMFFEALAENAGIHPSSVQPKISRVSNGSWEIIMEFALQSWATISHMANQPSVSAILNMSGMGALVIQALRLCAIGATKDSQTTRVLDEYKIKSPHGEVIVNQSARTLASNQKFRTAAETMIGFALLRPYIDSIEIRIDNQYVTFDKVNSAFTLSKVTY